VLSGERGRRVLTFTSAGPAAVILQQALGTPDPKSYDVAWRLRNSAQCSFLFDHERLSLEAWNVVGHLPEPGLWTLTGAVGADPREAIAAAVVAIGAGLMELTTERMDLESVFLRLYCLPPRGPSFQCLR
jgi:hypothetical protein